MKRKCLPHWILILFPFIFLSAQDSKPELAEGLTEVHDLFGSAAYSSLTVLGNGDIGLFFEKDYYSENMFVSFSLEWLTDGDDENKSIL